MRKYIIFIFILSQLPIGLFSQALDKEDFNMADTDSLKSVSLPVVEDYVLETNETLITTDSIVGAKVLEKTDSTTAKKQKFKPDAQKAVWLGAIIPGFGQIVNKKYWKLPIVYGGFIGCGYAVTWYSGKYQTYKVAYRDISDTDPQTNSYNLLLKGIPIEKTRFGNEKNFEAALKTQQDNLRRYRDLSILLSVIYYGMTILEAYVDAQLYDFDISPDLSMTVQPTLLNNNQTYMDTAYGRNASITGGSNAFGVQCSFRLK